MDGKACLEVQLPNMLTALNNKKEKLGVLLRFLASMTIDVTYNIGNWSATAHTLKIGELKLRVHFEATSWDRTTAKDKLYFNGMSEYDADRTMEELLGYSIPNGYISLKELQEKFPDPTLTCSFENCKVHQHTGIHLDTPIGEVPDLQE